MLKTAKLLLNKPEGHEYVDIDDLNANMDTLDIVATESTMHVPYAVASGTNVKTCTIPYMSALVEGLALSFKNTDSNTGAVTLNVNGLGAKPVVKANGNALSSGNLKAGSIYTVRYSGSNFILQGEGGEYGTATASQVLSGRTIGTEDGLVTGTMPNRGAGGTVTPGRTSQTKSSGYYSSAITISGDSSLISSNIAKGATIFGVVGSYEGAGGTYGTAVASDVLAGKTIGTSSGLVTGTMPNNGAGGTVVPGRTNQTKPAGYYSSAITIQGAADLLAANIVQGKSIFGVVGSLIPLGDEKKWASGIVSVPSVDGITVDVSGLGFVPKIIIVHLKNELSYFSLGLMDGAVWRNYFFHGTPNIPTRPTTKAFQLYRGGYGQEGPWQWFAFE